MNIHNNTPFRHQVTNLKKKKERPWRWQILAKLYLEKTDWSSEKTKKERNKPMTILRLTVTELEVGGEIVWWWQWQRLKLEVELWVRVSERGRKGWVHKWERERRVRLWGKWMGSGTAKCGIWEEVGFFSLYIYIRGFWVIICLNGSSPSRVWQNPDPLRIFFKDPYLTLLFIGPGEI